jgi:hypothetical protein
MQAANATEQLVNDIQSQGKHIGSEGKLHPVISAPPHPPRRVCSEVFFRLLYINPLQHKEGEIAGSSGRNLAQDGAPRPWKTPPIPAATQDMVREEE